MIFPISGAEPGPRDVRGRAEAARGAHQGQGEGADHVATDGPAHVPLGHTVQEHIKQVN